MVQVSGRVFFLLAPIKTGHLQLEVLPICRMDFLPVGSPIFFSNIFVGKSPRLWCFCLRFFFSSLISLPPTKISNRQNSVLRTCEYSAKWLLRISQIHELPRRSCWYCVFGLQSGGLKNGLIKKVDTLP